MHEVPRVLMVTHMSWPVVLVVSLIEGGAGTIVDPAATAALPGIVPDGQLEQAWTATEARTYSASSAGPVLGGVLFGAGPGHAISGRRRLLCGLVRHGDQDPAGGSARRRRSSARRCA